MIVRSDEVESFFGYWPEFADAKVSLFAFESSGTIRLDISYIDAELNKAAIVSLQFTGVRNVALTELMSENVIDRLAISMGTPMQVALEACFGLGGSFSCMGVEVLKVTPNNSCMDSPVNPTAQ